MLYKDTTTTTVMPTMQTTESTITLGIIASPFCWRLISTLATIRNVVAVQLSLSVALDILKEERLGLLLSVLGSMLEPKPAQEVP